MYKIKLSPYAKTFYNEWLLAPDSRRYNLAIDQTFYGNLDVEKLRTALKKYVSDHLLLNSHVQDINGEPYWVINDHIDELEYSDSPVVSSELLNYVGRSFDLYYGPLYRFKLIRVDGDTYRFIAVMHHLLMDGSALLDTGVFEAISKYYNDGKYAAKYSIDDQIKLIADLTDTLSTKLEQSRPEYKEFWHKQLFGVENIDLSFLNQIKFSVNKMLPNSVIQ